MNPPSITITTTLYNGEETIARTLDSVLSQLSENDEWIVVDDGSTDKSAAIVEDAFRGRPNCFLLRQNNSGLVQAFNRCLDHSTKDYLFNLDRGDYLLPNSLETIRNLAEKYSPDLIHLGFIELFDDGRVVDRPNFNEEMFFDSKEKMLSNPLIKERIPWFLSSHTRQAIRLSVIGQLRLEEPAVGSDNPFMDIIFCRCKSVAISPSLCYASYLPDGSISRRPIPIECHAPILKRYLGIVPALISYGNPMLYPLVEAADIFYAYRNYVLSTFGTKMYDTALSKRARRIIRQNKKMIFPAVKIQEKLFNALMLAFPRAAVFVWKTKHK